MVHSVLPEAMSLASTAQAGFTVIFTGDNFTRLLAGLWTSISIAGLALIIGIPLGVILGALRTLPNPVLRVVLRIYLECFRILPTLVVLFLAYYILPAEFNVQVSGPTVAVVAFGLWVSAEISDIVRGALVSVSDHQVDAGKALGMSSVEAEDENDLTWESRKGSEPLRVIVSGANRIRVVPEPTEPVALSLTVYRTPPEALFADAACAADWSGWGL